MSNTLIPASGSFSLTPFAVVAIPLAHGRRAILLVTHRNLIHDADFARMPKEFILLFDLCHLCNFEQC
jgi:hypothetical protein